MVNGGESAGLQMLKISVLSSTKSSHLKLTCIQCSQMLFDALDKTI